jgi:hypothetical protein
MRNIWHQERNTLTTPWEYYVVAYRYDVNAGGAGPMDVRSLLSNSDGQFLDVAMDGRGRAIALWDEWSSTKGNTYTYQIWSKAFDPVGSSWSAEKQVPPLSSRNSQRAITVGMNARGDAAVVWTEAGQTVARYAATGSPWGAAVVLGSNAPSNGPYQVRLDDAGDALVAWTGGSAARAASYSSCGENCPVCEGLEVEGHEGVEFGFVGRVELR